MRGSWLAWSGMAVAILTSIAGLWIIEVRGALGGPLGWAVVCGYAVALVILLIWIGGQGGRIRGLVRRAPREGR